MLLIALVCAALFLTLASAARQQQDKDVNAVLQTKQRWAVLGNRSVTGAMIFTDPNTAGLLGRDFYRVPQGVNGTAVANAQARVSHGKKFIEELPFPVESWWSVFAQSCPWRTTKGNDRGVMMAHYQIWLDWVYQGRRGVDKAVATDRDLLIVFEDDAVVAVRDLPRVLGQELRDMTTDLLFLGWCYGHKRMPMCTHAYAVTRQGVQKMLAEWDVCSTFSIDGQWAQMARHQAFSWAKARIELYKVSPMQQPCKAPRKPSEASSPPFLKPPPPHILIPS